MPELNERLAGVQLPQLDLIVNAGGGSRRMGTDKALLPVPPEGTPLLRHVLDRLQPLGPRRTIVVANDAALPRKAGLTSDVRLQPDRYPNAGSLGGLASGLALAEGWAVCVACDMPLINAALFAFLASLTDAQQALTGDLSAPEATYLAQGATTPPQQGVPAWDAIVPLTEGYPQPFHALYHRRCLPAIEALLAGRTLRIVEFYAQVRVRYVPETALRRYDPDLRSFINVNTPSDWQHALTLMESDNGQQ